MIRWTEQKDSYRLDVSHHARAELLGGIALFLVFMVLMMFVGALLFYQDARSSVWPGMIVSGCLLLAAGQCSRASRSYRAQLGWVEIPVRGGRARWCVEDAYTTEFRAVVRFELVQGVEGNLSIEALLPGGARERVMGPWCKIRVAKMAKIAEDLNANLGTIESSAATLPPPQ